MKLEIKVPAMGESIVEATIGAFLKESGVYVEAEDELIELETDKVNQALYAPQSGVVTWNVAKDDVVKIGQTIGVIDTDQQASKSSTSKASASKTTKTPSNEPVLETPTKSLENLITTTPNKSSNEGTRKTKEGFIQEFSSPPPSQERPKPATKVTSQAEPSMSKDMPKETRKKMSKIRKIIATRLVDVLQQTAMLTTFNEVDMTNVIALRESYKEAFLKQYNARLGYMSFFIKAAVSALQAFPEVNAYIDGDEIVYRNYYDIGIAVGTEKGLIVPVIKACDTLSFAQIEQSIDSYAKKAREGGLSPNDLQGGGFTITNGGTYGSLLSTPILNPPQSAILGMHKIMKRPVVVNDAIVIRQMMYLALSYDHRIIDGKEAVSFLVHIKNVLEDPARLLLNI